MLTPLRVLILEDRSSDAELLAHELRRAGFDPDWRRAEREAEYLAHLEAPLDLILADYSLPEFDAIRALQLLRMREADIPLIVVTGSISEEAAVECIKLGAADYLFKDRLARLGSAVRQALTQQELRAYKRMAEVALQESEERFRAIFASTALGIAIVDLDGRLIMSNPAFQEMLGYTDEELQRMAFIDYTHPDDAASSLQRFNELVAGECGHYQIEKRYVQKGGRLLWVRLSVSLARDADNAPQFVIVTVEDITTRRQADETRARLAAVVDSSDDAIISIGPDRKVLSWNRGAEQVYGYAAEEIVGQPAALVLPSNRSYEGRQIMDRIMRGEGGVHFESRRVRKDGRLFDVALTISPIKDSSGQITGASVIARDVTARKQADEARARMAAIVDSSDDAILGTAPDATILSWNAGAQRIYGYTSAEVIGQPAAILAPPALQAESAQLLERLRSGERISHYETTRARNDGRLIDVALTISPIKDAQGNVTGFSTIARDISERKRAEQTLHRQTTFVHLLQVVAVAANEAASVEDVLQTAIDQICAHIGWPVGHVYLPDPETPGGFTPTQIWHLEDLQRFDSFRKITEAVHLAPRVGLPGRALATRKPAWISDMILDPTTPRTRLIRDIGVRASFAFPVLVGDEVTAVLEFFSAEAIEPDEELLDVMAHVGAQLGRIFERTRAETALREGEERFRVLFEHSPDAILLIDPHHPDVSWPIVGCNEAACRMNGYPREELIGRSIDILHVTEADPAERAAYFDRLRSSGMVHIEAIHRRKDGTLYPIDVSTSLITLAGRELVMGTDRDVTERKQTEEALRAAEAKYRTLVEQIPAIIYTAEIDERNPTSYVSPQIEAILGFSPDEWMADQELWLKQLHPDDRDYVLAETARAQSSDEPIPSEYRVFTRDGRIVWLRDATRVVRDEAGRPLFLQGISLDISERKHAEQRSLAFAALGRQLGSATTAEAAARVVADVADDLLGWDAFVLNLYSADTNTLRYVLSYDIVDGRRAEVPMPAHGMPSPMAQRVFTEGPQLITLDEPMLNNLELVSFGDDERPSASLLFVPIRHSETAIGILSIQSYTHQAYTAEDLATLQSLADHCSGALERIRVAESLRESENLYRMLWIATNDAMAMSDANGIVLAANPAYTKLYGYPLEEVVGRSFATVFPPEQRVTAEETYKKGFETQPSGQLFESIVERTDGVQHMVEARIDFLEQGGRRQAMLSIVRDITERKRAEEALAEERALLARRVAERTADLSAANADLARAARLKDEFLASMSHELRTPLNAVLGLSEALQEQVYGLLNDQQCKALRTIEESGRHLLVLINDILDLAKVGAGKLELDLDIVPIESLCQASVRLVKQDAHKKQIVVSTAIDPAVTALHTDARRLKQILVNLLSNAVKFTPAGGKVGLEVTGDTAQQAVHLTVWDTGIGIANEDMARLFQPFVQLDSRLARQYSGSGLGLALVYRMVEMHGGSVTVASEPGAGSRFTVSLPWHSTDGAVEPERIAPTQELTIGDRAAIHTALIVEDSPTAATQLARYLHELSITAVTHPQGADVIERALELRPDLIVLDVLLPDTSGWSVLERLKADPRTRPIPVLIVSVVDDCAQGVALGAADYLIKPFTREGLRQALWKLPPTGTDGATTASRASLEQAPALANSTILLVEDNEASIATMSDYLGVRGYQVMVARNGAEAVARASELQPALILMDIQMPGMDGMEATRRIRAQGGLVRIPIIALTALAMPGDRERCLEAGADDYLTKPVNLRALLTTIETFLHPPVTAPRNL